MIRSMAELRMKYGPGRAPKEIVSRETISLDARRNRGHGVDWSPAELEILRRDDLRPSEMTTYLPGRTLRAILIKRHRIGASAKYMTCARALRGPASDSSGAE
jgi:hypothetical protein